jgi:GH24 family phage-related lysozyme (muramidase)
MRYLLLVLFITVNSWIVSPKEGVHKIYSIKSTYVINEIKKKRLYDSTINFIKQHEGFRANWYDDKGYMAIGYGQRKAFYKGVIQAPITKTTATEILKISFSKHMKIVESNYKYLTYNQKLSIAHLSFCAGIGKINKLKLIKNNQLDSTKLIRILPHKKNRQFEIDLFYNKI